MATPNDQPSAPSGEAPLAADYSFVSAPARVAVYDDLRSAPRIIMVEPATTAEFIEKLTTTVYEQARLLGGGVPYTVVREVSENFIHAAFREVVVSILDGGNTIRFADQGPGIDQKDKAQLPGFSSAIEPMKPYIRGVGSGLPIVKEYLGGSQGHLTIEDNLKAGSVITISLGSPNPTPHDQAQAILGPTAEAYAALDQAHAQAIVAPLSARERSFLGLLLNADSLSVTELSQMTDTAMSSTHAALKKLQEAGLVETTSGKKRRLTPLGRQGAAALS